MLLTVMTWTVSSDFRKISRTPLICLSDNSSAFICISSFKKFGLAIIPLALFQLISLAPFSQLRGNVMRKLEAILTKRIHKQIELALAALQRYEFQLCHPSLSCLRPHELCPIQVVRQPALVQLRASKVISEYG